MSMRVPILNHNSRNYSAVDVRLRDGSVLENIAIDGTGMILGRIIGGQDGLDERPLPFNQEEVAAYRLRAGFAARFGMAKWRLLER